jgi:hypothetical protein
VDGEQLGRDVLKLEHRDAVQALLDFAEDLMDNSIISRVNSKSPKKEADQVIRIPCVIEVVNLAVLLEPAARLACVGQLSPKRLDEADLSQRLGTALYHLMERLESRKHGIDVVLALRSSGISKWIYSHFGQDGSHKTSAMLPRAHHATARLQHQLVSKASQPAMKDFTPKNCDADKLLRNQRGLIDQRRAVVTKLVEDRHSRLASSGTRIFGCDR